MDTGHNDIEPVQARRKPGPARRSGHEAAADIARYLNESGLAKGEKLPAESTLRELLGLSHYTLREALNELRTTGVIITINGRGSFIGHGPRPTVIRDVANPYRDLEHIRACDARFPATPETAAVFGIAPRTRLYVKEELCKHRITDAYVRMTRQLPMPVLFGIEPAPDAYGDRADLTAALADKYGNLHYRVPYRVVTDPAPEVRSDLELETGTPVIEHRTLTCTTTGRVLMIETDTTPATSGEWQQII